MHNAALAALGLPGRYEAHRVAPPDLSDAMARLRAGEYQGANVTVPHKEAVFRLVDDLSGEARIIGAVNTVVRDGGRLRGENTDAPGLLAALEHALGAVPYGMRILLLGAGGAARAAAAALLAGGPAGLSIYNRDGARAQALAAAMHERFGGRILAVSADEARQESREVDLIVNATSAGLDGRSLPLDGLGVRPGGALYDMVYTPSPTPLMRHLSGLGAHVSDGLDMLVFQAAASFRLWLDRDAPVGVMRKAALDELRRRGVR